MPGLQGCLTCSSGRASPKQTRRPCPGCSVGGSSVVLGTPLVGLDAHLNGLRRTASRKSLAAYRGCWPASGCGRSDGRRVSCFVLIARAPGRLVA